MTDVSVVETDWADIEKAYRAGREPLRAIAARHPGVNHVAIKRKADKEGWERDLSWKIAEKTAALVTRDAVTTPVTRIDSVTEKQIVEANAEIQANVIRSERKDITRYRGLVSKLFTELEASTDNTELMSQIGELMAAPDEAGIDKINEIYRKTVSLPGRVDMAKKLVETFEKLVNAERKVFNILDDDAADEGKVRVHEIRLIAVRPDFGRVIDVEVEYDQ
jgi:hypothetical protein